MANLNITINGFKDKPAIIIQDYALHGDKTIPTDTPVILTGIVRVCVRKNTGVAFLKIEVRPVTRIDGLEDVVFVEDDYVAFL